MTRNDLLLIVVLIIFVLMPLVIDSCAEKKFAVVKVDGVIVRKLDLSADETFTLESRGGKNIVEVRGGAVRVVAADCPEKICVRRGAIAQVGETIACVPHKILIEVVGD